MTLHIPYNHQCPTCEAWYIPYDQVPCPRCGLVEERRFDFIPQAAASASFNLADQGSYQPGAWSVNCYADHLLGLLFIVLEHHRTSLDRPFVEAAREAVDQMDWGDQLYAKEHLYGIAVRVHEELEKLRIRREKSFLHRIFRRIFYRAANPSSAKVGERTTLNFGLRFLRKEAAKPLLDGKRVVGSGY